MTDLIRYDAMCTAIAEEDAKRIAAAEWIAAARSSFVPSPRRPCAVCGKFQSITHAHHITPLVAQRAFGYSTPDHAHAWVCPTHHAVLHVLLGPRPGRADPRLMEAMSDMKDDIEWLLGLVPGYVVQQLRKAANARMRHADALEAWAASNDTLQTA